MHKYLLKQNCLTSLNSLVEVVQWLAEVNDAAFENVSTGVNVDDADDSEEEANRQRFHFRRIIFCLDFRNNFWTELFVARSFVRSFANEGRLGIYRRIFAFVSMRIPGKRMAHPRTQNDADMTRA